VYALGTEVFDFGRTLLRSLLPSWAGEVRCVVCEVWSLDWILRSCGCQTTFVRERLVAMSMRRGRLFSFVVVVGIPNLVVINYFKCNKLERNM
jgi:hypothetical protein